MVRIATVNDAEQLNILNDEFNGESETSIDNIRNSLMNNKQEVVIVADEDDMLRYIPQKSSRTVLRNSI